MPCRPPLRQRALGVGQAHSPCTLRKKRCARSRVGAGRAAERHVSKPSTASAPSAGANVGNSVARSCDGACGTSALLIEHAARNASFASDAIAASRSSRAGLASAADTPAASASVRAGTERLFALVWIDRPKLRNAVANAAQLAIAARFGKAAVPLTRAKRERGRPKNSSRYSSPLSPGSSDALDAMMRS